MADPTLSCRRRRRPAPRSTAPALVLAAFLALSPALACAQETFLAGIEDLPLMPGLDQVADAGVVFDKPSGRIVEVYAEGPVERDAVLAFYRRTLPQLGWRAVSGAAFQREGEQLELVFLGTDGDLIVRFTLQPE